MKTPEETFASIRRVLLSKCEDVHEIRKEMETLARHYYHYLRLKGQLESDWKRIIYVVRLIGSDRMGQIVESDRTGILRQIGSDPQSNDADSKLPVWKALRECLRESGEATIRDIRRFLESMDYENVSRQRIESAIKRHRAEFRVRTRGRQRLVSLREDEEHESADE